MAATITLPLATYPPGTYNIGPASVPSGLTKFHAVIDATLFTDPAIVLVLNAQRSFDAGATWNPMCNVVMHGEVLFDRLGNRVTAFEVNAAFEKGSGNENRRIKASIVLSGGSLRTSVLLEIT